MGAQAPEPDLDFYLPLPNMNRFKTLIKGILLSTILIGVLSLNLTATQTVHAQTNNTAITANVGATGGSSTATPAPAAATGGGAAAQSGGAAATNANAASQAATETGDINLPLILETVAKASTYVNHIFNPLIYFFSFNIGNFLSNDYIYGGKMGEMLQSIWVVARNIVNIIFVLILLFLAVRHIFSSDENTDLKKVLPKFALMLIAINFSWLGTRVVLDAANVATNVVFAIPSGVKGVIGEDLDATLNSGDNVCQIKDAEKNTMTGLCSPDGFWYPADTKRTRNLTNCNKDQINQQYAEQFPNPDDPNAPAYKNNDLDGVATICWQQMDIANYSHNNASYYLSFSMARVQNLTRASTQDSIGQVAIGTLFALIIQIVYLVAFASLYVALILRVAALWFLVAFSPFLILIYFLTKDLQFQAGGLEEQFSIQAFISWAFAPAKVGAVWTIGFIMITTGQAVTTEFFSTLNEQGDVTSKVFKVQSLFAGTESIQQFIWLLMTTIIIWMGTFAILTKLKVGQRFFNAINDYGTRLATEVAKSPRWAPIMPVYDFENKEWTRGSLAQAGATGPLGALEGMKRKYSEPSRADQFVKAEQALKSSKVDTNSINRMVTGSAKVAYDEYMNSVKGTGVSNGSILENPERFKRHLKATGRFKTDEDLERAHKNIIAGARQSKGELPEKVRQESAPTPSRVIDEKAIERGVSRALQRTKVTMSELEDGTNEKAIAAKAAILMQADNKLSENDALTQAINSLKKKPEGEAPKQ